MKSLPSVLRKTVKAEKANKRHCLRNSKEGGDIRETGRLPQKKSQQLPKQEKTTGKKQKSL